MLSWPATGITCIAVMIGLAGRWMRGIRSPGIDGLIASDDPVAHNIVLN
jgi:hypothetical protein